MNRAEAIKGMAVAVAVAVATPQVVAGAHHEALHKVTENWWLVRFYNTRTGFTRFEEVVATDRESAARAGPEIAAQWEEGWTCREINPLRPDNPENVYWRYQ